jgi:transcriptional regulator with XRE-family HTH domain
MEQATTDIGSRLLHAREQRGLTLRDIANATKISMPALRAIEQNDFARLPGGLFSRAYIRAFATEVGLNADALVLEYRATFEVDVTPNPDPRDEEAGDARSDVPLRVAGVLATGIVLIIGGLLTSNPTQTPQVPLDEESTRNTVDGADRPDSATPVDVTNGEDEVAFADAKVVAADQLSLRLDLRANGPCWVSAVADGERVAYRLMKAGERAVVEARNSITLRIGDAGAIDYSINGATGRRLGGPGEVITVRFTRENVDRYADPEGGLPRDGEASRVRPDPRRLSRRSKQEATPGVDHTGLTPRNCALDCSSLGFKLVSNVGDHRPVRRAIGGAIVTMLWPDALEGLTPPSS